MFFIDSDKACVYWDKVKDCSILNTVNTRKQVFQCIFVSSYKSNQSSCRTEYIKALLLTFKTKS